MTTVNYINGHRKLSEHKALNTLTENIYKGLGKLRFISTRLPPSPSISIMATSSLQLPSAGPLYLGDTSSRSP